MLQNHLVSPFCKKYSSAFDLCAFGGVLLALQHCGAPCHTAAMQQLMSRNSSRPCLAPAEDAATPAATAVLFPRRHCLGPLHRALLSYTFTRWGDRQAQGYCACLMVFACCMLSQPNEALLCKKVHNFYFQMLFKNMLYIVFWTLLLCGHPQEGLLL